MRSLLWAAATIALLLLLGACSPQSDALDQGSLSTSPPTTKPPTTTAATEPPVAPSDDVINISKDGLQIIVPPDSEGNLPMDLMVGCPSGPQFPLSSLDDIRYLIEADPGGVAEAIETFLNNEEGEFWPQEDWRILHETDLEVSLVNQTASGELAFMTVANDGGGWNWTGASINGSPCQLQYTTPPALNSVEWSLDPAAPAIAPDTTTIEVLISERECVSGQEIGDRLLGPQIVMTETAVMIAFAAKPPEGDAFNCQGNPEIAYTIELPEPVGERDVFADRAVGISLEDYLD